MSNRMDTDALSLPNQMTIYSTHTHTHARGRKISMNVEISPNTHHADRSVVQNSVRLFWYVFMCKSRIDYLVVNTGHCANDANGGGYDVWVAALSNICAIHWAIHHSNYRLETINCLFETALTISRRIDDVAWHVETEVCVFHELGQVLMSFYVFAEKIIIDLIIN